MNTEIKMTKVESQNIKSIGFEKDFKYDIDKRARNVLAILFNNDALYYYLDVSKRTFTAFLEAKSKGTFFQQRIRNKYITLKRK